jgi:ubiquinone/menaquinone biosynthesis C-methylase UbiE
MYPLFYIWFKRKNIDKIMNLKSLVYEWSDEEFAKFYQELDSLARDRATDLNTKCIEFIMQALDPEAKSLIDVGCGGGYFANKVAALKKYETHACDLLDHVEIVGGTYHKANIENLPFADKSFDIVTCHHTLEHVRHLNKAVSELKRITRRQLIVVVPRQKYYYYTLDEHINFFPIKSTLVSLIGIQNHICENLWGDWVYIGYLSKEAR